MQDLGYNVIFTGGERTLEKYSDNIDMQRFDLEGDPMFKQRTAQFDRGMLMNSILVDRGLVTQLDAELAEASKQLLITATSRLPRKNADLDALERERERNFKSKAWNNDYIGLINENLKLSDLYGPENPGLCPGNFIVLD